MLKVQRHHQVPCTRPEWDQRSCAGKGAKCPVLIIGTLNGNRIRLSTAKFLPPTKARDLEAARSLALQWEFSADMHEVCGAGVGAHDFGSSMRAAVLPRELVEERNLFIRANIQSNLAIRHRGLLCHNSSRALSAPGEALLRDAALADFSLDSIGLLYFLRRPITTAWEVLSAAAPRGMHGGAVKFYVRQAQISGSRILLDMIAIR